MTLDLMTAIHDARRRLADDLDGLPEHSWHTPSLCASWDVEHVVAHLTAVASLGRAAWVRSIALSGFRPAVHNERRLREHLGASPEETLAGFRAVSTSIVTPTDDLAAYLGEVLVHGEDIRRPLAMAPDGDVAAATEVARFYASRNFAVPSRTVAAGLRLCTDDGPFTAGAGPEVTGPTLALVMALAGRSGHLDQLDGPGVALLAARIS